MKYDFDTVLSRTGTGCIKWDKPFACSDEQTVLPLWVADMDFPCSTEIQEALHRRVEEQIYGYSCGFDDAYRNSVTGWFQRRFQWTIAADSIFYAGGVVPAIAYLLEILSEEGDSILRFAIKFWQPGAVLWKVPCAIRMESTRLTLQI